MKKRWVLLALLLCAVFLRSEAQALTTTITFSPDGVQIAGEGAAVMADGAILVGKGGTYVLSGTLAQGQLYVETAGKEYVTLLFNGVELYNAAEPALYIENAGSVTLMLAEGSVNRVQSGVAVDVSQNQAADEASGGAVYARDDLSIDGNGQLFVGGYINNGIQTTNHLRILGGQVEVQALNHGLKGKDAVTIDGGSITITAAADGIQSDDTDGNGIITLNGGMLNIACQGDAVQAETQLVVNGGNLSAVTAGGSQNAETKVESGFGGGRGGFGGGFGGRGGRHQGWDMDDEVEESDGVSSKGLKSGGALAVYGGLLSLDCRDDALHSDDSLLIAGGTLALSSGDDGVHADKVLRVEGGQTQILQSYEGLEANQITLAGGEVSLFSLDDGVNANGGSSMRGWWGGRPEESQEDAETSSLYISGGTLYVHADGDGLDSNGNLIVAGGTVIVDGPESSANGALDSGTESGGVCRVNGGTVLAVGASGMAAGFDADSEQCAISWRLSGGFEAGSTVSVTDAQGTVLFSHKAAKSASSVIFSSPQLRLGETYLLTAGSHTQEITLTEMSTSIGGRSRWGW